MRSSIFTLLLVAGGFLSAMAQGHNIIFFAPEGEQFYVIINGIRQNDDPQTNVKVQGLTGMVVKAKVIFADTQLGEVDKNIPLPEQPVEYTFQVKKTKNGEYAMKYFGEVPIAQAPPTPPTQTVVVVNTEPKPPITQTTTTTVVTGTGTTTGTSESVNMGVNMGGFGMNVNVNVNDGTGGGVVYEETTTTTVTTTTTGTGAPTPAPAPGPDHYVMPGYTGPIGCPWPMQPADFNSAKGSIASKSFEDSKLTIAKQIFNSNCLTSDQVRDIMGLFTFEDSKLDFAKYAYGRTFDLGNYYKVNDAFTFESSIDDLNDFINGGGGGW